MDSIDVRTPIAHPTSINDNDIKLEYSIAYNKSVIIINEYLI